MEFSSLCTNISIKHNKWIFLIHYTFFFASNENFSCSLFVCFTVYSNAGMLICVIVIITVYIVYKCICLTVLKRLRALTHITHNRFQFITINETKRIELKLLVNISASCKAKRKEILVRKVKIAVDVFFLFLKNAQQKSNCFTFSPLNTHGEPIVTLVGYLFFLSFFIIII